jgi:subtilisin family serine protease
MMNSMRIAAAFAACLAELGLNCAEAATRRWNLDRIDQRFMPLSATMAFQDDVGNNYDGTGVHVYVVDHQIKTTHSDFGGRVGAGYTVHAPTRSIDLCDNHGTHVAGIVGGKTNGVATGVTLHSVKVHACKMLVDVVNEDGVLEERWINDSDRWQGFGAATIPELVKALDWIRTSHYRQYPGSRAVVNISQTIRPVHPKASAAVKAQTALWMTQLDAAVNRLIDAGIVVVIAAANENADACTFSPARVARAITVGATTKTDEKLPMSNWGACLDIWAPGGGPDIVSAGWSRTSNTATATGPGTSMAAPHVAGVAALFLQRNPWMTVAGVSTAIRTNGTRGALVGDIGAGSPNRLLYFGHEGWFPAIVESAKPVARNDNLGYLSVGDNLFYAPLHNDSDPDGDTIRIIDAGGGDPVTIESNGTELYIQPSTTGSKRIQYMITDGRGGTATAVISYQVQ